jgi:hypothetical protein
MWTNEWKIDDVITMKNVWVRFVFSKAIVLQIQCKSLKRNFQTINSSHWLPHCFSSSHDVTSRLSLSGEARIRIQFAHTATLTTHQLNWPFFALTRSRCVLIIVCESMFKCMQHFPEYFFTSFLRSFKSRQTMKSYRSTGIIICKFDLPCSNRGTERENISKAIKFTSITSHINRKKHKICTNFKKTESQLKFKCGEI